MDGGDQLRHLFQTCDRHRRGYIDRDEFGELCATFQIDSTDVDVIFSDLDRDRDQRIRLTTLFLHLLFVLFVDVMVQI